MKSVSSKLGVAQVGCGYWGPNLLRVLSENKDVMVKFLVDQSEDRRAFANRKYQNLQTVDDVQVAFDDPSVDAIVLATPANTHFELAIRALKCGKHVLVEKPLASTPKEVLQIKDLATDMGLVAMVGHTFLYNSAVRFVKELIDSDDLGDIRYIYSQRLNLGRIRSDVDALWNLAPHDISIIQYWLGEPEPLSYQRHGMSYVQDGIDDVVFATIQYPDKVIANIHVSWLDPQKVRRMTIVGSKKMVVYDDVADNKIAIYDKGIDRMAVLGENMEFDKPGAFEFDHRSGDVVWPKIPWKEPLATEIGHFVDCVTKREICLTGPDHARKVVQILHELSHAGN